VGVEHEPAAGFKINVFELKTICTRKVWQIRFMKYTNRVDNESRNGEQGRPGNTDKGEEKGSRRSRREDAERGACKEMANSGGRKEYSDITSSRVLCYNKCERESSIGV
jgi:hypothetical protein